MTAPVESIWNEVASQWNPNGKSADECQCSQTQKPESSRLGHGSRLRDLPVKAAVITP